MILQLDFPPRASAIFTYSVCWRMGLMHCGKRCSQTERETEADKLVQKFRHGVLCRSGNLLMRHWDVYTANNNEISDGQTAGGGARIRGEDRHEVRGLKGGSKEEGKWLKNITQHAFWKWCVLHRFFFICTIYLLPSNRQTSEWGGTLFLSLFLCVCVFLTFPFCLLSFLLTVGICFGCTVYLSMFHYVSADFVFTVHNFTEFIIPSLSVLHQYMCLQLPKAYPSK